MNKLHFALPNIKARQTGGHFPKPGAEVRQQDNDMGLVVQTAGQTHQDICSSLSKGMPSARFTLRKSLLS